ncbi:MAG: hypothetical protein IJE43_03790 [Alphaproteobacteria bacterium]|nr:hypothetical protein [Alphaproteobacteria bacterium]
MAELKNVNLKFQSTIESKVGLSVNEIINQSYDDIITAIEKKYNKKLTLDNNVEDLNYRGSMLLAEGLIDYDIDKEFNSIF